MTNIAKSINELNQLFRDISSFVVEQGSLASYGIFSTQFRHNIGSNRVQCRVRRCENWARFSVPEENWAVSEEGPKNEGNFVYGDHSYYFIGHVIREVGSVLVNIYIQLVSLCWWRYDCVKNPNFRYHVCYVIYLFKHPFKNSSA